MNLFDAISHLFPDADPLSDFRVEQTDAGQQITVWRIRDGSGQLQPIPAAAELARAYEAAVHARAAEKVRQEADRRMVELLGARSSRHKDILISNAIREAITLTRKEAGAGLDKAEQARAAKLEAVNAAIDAIRDASNALETADPIPADFRDDRFWPART